MVTNYYLNLLQKTEKKDAADKTKEKEFHKYRVTKDNDLDVSDYYAKLKLLERKLKFLEIQEEYIKDEVKNLKRELLRAQEEVRLLIILSLNYLSISGLESFLDTQNYSSRAFSLALIILVQLWIIYNLYASFSGFTGLLN